MVKLTLIQIGEKENLSMHLFFGHLEDFSDLIKELNPEKYRFYITYLGSYLPKVGVQDDSYLMFCLENLYRLIDEDVIFIEDDFEVDFEY